MWTILIGIVFFIVAAAPVALTLWLLVFAARAATTCVGLCRRCGYDLRGLGRIRRCPECGQPFDIDAQGNIIS